MDNQPFTQVTYGPVTLRAETAQKKPKTSAFFGLSLAGSLLGNAATYLRTLIVNAALIVTLVTLISLIISELREEPVIIEAFSVPSALEKRGLSGGVVAHRMWDAVTHIQQNSFSEKELQRLTTASRQLDIKEPNSGLTLQGLTTVLRAFLNLPQTRITGEVTCATADCAWADVSMRVRVVRDNEVLSRDVGAAGALDPNAYLFRAAEKAMEQIDPYTLVTFLHQDFSRRPEAMSLAENIIEQQLPDRAYAAYFQGWNNVLLGNTDYAQLWFENAIDVMATDNITGFGRPWLHLGTIFLNRGDTDKALSFYQKAIEVDPTLAYAWRGWGLILQEQGDHPGAEEKFQEAYNQDPLNNDHLMDIGDARLAQNRLFDAMDAFTQTIQFGSNFEDGWQRWETTLFQLDDPSAIAAELETAIEQEPGNPTYRLQLGLVQNLSGEFDKSVENIEAVTVAYPGYALAWASWGRVLFDQEHWDDSIDKYQIALEKDPNMISVWVDLGNAQTEASDLDSAIATFEAALKLNPQDATALEGLATASARNGDFSTANLNYGLALEANPDYAFAAENWAVELDYVLANAPSDTRCGQSKLYTAPFKALAAALVPNLGETQNILQLAEYCADIEP